MSFSRPWNQEWYKTAQMVHVSQPEASCIRSQMQRILLASAIKTQDLVMNSTHGQWLILYATSQWNSSQEPICRLLWPRMPDRDKLPTQQVLALIHVSMIMPIQDARIAQDPLVVRYLDKTKASDTHAWVLDRILPLRRIHVAYEKKTTEQEQKQPTAETNQPWLSPVPLEILEKIQQQLTLSCLETSELEALCHVVMLHLLPKEATTDKDMEAKIPVAKNIRMTYPSSKELKEMRHVQQNSALWHECRKPSYGSSELGCVCGLDSYRHNIDMWKRDVGLIAEDERFKEEFFNFDHGHFWEHAVFQNNPKFAIYCILMRCKGREVGILLHPQYPYNHSSLDGMIHYTKYVFSNLFAMEDWLQAIIEIKNMVFQMVMSKEKNGVMHKISATHAIQCMNQMDCSRRPFESIPSPLMSPFLASFLPPRHNDYVATWRMNEKKSPNEIKSSQHKVLLQFMMQFISRVYYDSAIAHVIQDYLKKHVDAVRSRQPPQRVSSVHLPPLHFLPIKHVVWYLHFEPTLDSLLTQPFQYWVKDRLYSTQVQVLTNPIIIEFILFIIYFIFNL